MSQQPIKIEDSVIIDLIVNQGQEELKNVIYKRYFQKVYYSCWRRVQEREIAKDLAHDVLLKIFSNLAQYQGRSSFGMWVRAIAHNYSIDYLRKQKRMYFETYEEESLGNILVDEDTIASKILLEKRSDLLKGMIANLKVKDQTVIKMRYYEGLSIKEISEAIGSGVSATKMRLKRAKMRLIERASELQVA